MFSIGNRERNTLSCKLGFVGTENHLQRRHSIFRSGNRLTIIFNRINQIDDRKVIAAGKRRIVNLQRFPFLRGIQPATSTGADR